MTRIPGENIIRPYERFHCTAGRGARGSVVVQDERRLYMNDLLNLYPLSVF